MKCIGLLFWFSILSRILYLCICIITCPYYTIVSRIVTTGRLFYFFHYIKQENISNEWFVYE
uniref:Uncharacterized protein n=1 Tax=Schistosoma mansoni TaxID=6183 RepID=A0A5K4F819_SCHMA